MSDEERDVDIESDADKRAHHNALERRRRDHIKYSFSSLRDAVPSLQGEKNGPSSSKTTPKVAHRMVGKFGDGGGWLPSLTRASWGK